MPRFLNIFFFFGYNKWKFLIKKNFLIHFDSLGIDSFQLRVQSRHL